MLQAYFVCLLSATGIWAGLKLLHSAWAALLLYHLVLVSGLVWRGRQQRDAGAVLRGWRLVPVLLLVLISAAFGFAFFDYIRDCDPSGSYVLKQLQRTGLGGSALLPLASYTCVVNPVLEELYWRGNYLAARGWVFDLFYALIHIPLFALPGRVPVPYWPFHIVGLVVAGLLWRYTARRCGGLASSVAGHVASDVAIFAAIAFSTP
jgi:membrane protease YdiL (CAAX protease family)